MTSLTIARLRRVAGLVGAAVGVSACDSLTKVALGDVVFVGTHASSAKVVKTTRPDTFQVRIVVDVARGEVRQLRDVTMASGFRLQPQIRVWSAEPSGFNRDLRGSCDIFDEQNFRCRVWPAEVSRDSLSFSPHLSSWLKMAKGALIEINGEDTIRYTRTRSRLP